MWRKRAFPKLNWGTRGDKLLLGITFAILFLACGSCIGLGLFVSNLRVKNDFCQPTDTTYQFIVANMEAWSEHFSSIDRRYDKDWLQVRTPDGERVTVFMDYSLTPDSELVMYVSTLFSWPDTPKGSGGYLIIPAGSPPEWWRTWYDLQPMSHQISCYRDNGRTSL
jgi:hypothetical protein